MFESCLCQREMSSVNRSSLLLNVSPNGHTDSNAGKPSEEKGRPRSHFLLLEKPESEQLHHSSHLQAAAASAGGAASPSVV